jgi:arabinofuranosyltransferase
MPACLTNLLINSGYVFIISRAKILIMLNSDDLKRFPAGLFIGTMIIIISGLVFYSSTVDDAFINFRYAENFASGMALGQFNQGDAPVEGYTTTLLVLLLALGKTAGISVLTLSKIIGWLSLIGLFAVFYHMEHLAANLPAEFKQHNTWHIISFIIPGFLPLAWYAVSGMETTLYIFLLALFLIAALRYYRNPGIYDLAPAILLYLTRPEGTIAVYLTYIGIMAYQLINRHRYKYTLIKILIFSGFLILITIWRLHYYGYPLPNTYYAKVADGDLLHVLLGLAYLKRAFFEGGYWVFFIIFVFIIINIIRGHKLSFSGYTILSLAVAYTAFIMTVGGDNWSAFPFYRHLIHLLPVFLFLTATGIFMLGGNGRGFAAIFVVIIIIFLNLQMLALDNQIREEIKRLNIAKFLIHAPPPIYNAWIIERFPKNTRLAVTACGTLPYYTGFHTIDMLGLTNEHVAHHGKFERKMVDSKSDMEYVLSLRPDLMQTSIDPWTILNNEAYDRTFIYRQRLELTTIDNPIFRDEYLFIKNAPYHADTKSLFINKNFYESLPNQDDFEVIPVKNTSLYY